VVDVVGGARFVVRDEQAARDEPNARDQG
jgi:hypothetical protein